MKIDVFPHIVPPKYKEALFKRADNRLRVQWFDRVINGTPALFDLDSRFRLIERHEGLMQVLTIALPAIETVADPEDAVYLSKLANDEMAELVAKYPDKFVAAVACLPMNDIDAALEETDRAIKDLKFKGVQIFTPSDGRPLDLPEFMPLYEKMSQYDLPIWIHPARSPAISDYSTEDLSKYGIFQKFGWPYETTAAMTRLVYSGILEKYPGVKFITHHCGAMIPHFADRIVGGQDYDEAHLKAKYKEGISKPVLEYFRMFYADTALSGSTHGLMCSHAFFGAEHILFGTDAPFDSEDGDRFTRDTIRSIELMDIPEPEKDLIFKGNAKRLLHLNI